MRTIMTGMRMMTIGMETMIIIILTETVNGIMVAHGYLVLHGWLLPQSNRLQGQISCSSLLPSQKSTPVWRMTPLTIPVAHGLLFQVYLHLQQHRQHHNDHNSFSLHILFFSAMASPFDLRLSYWSGGRRCRSPAAGVLTPPTIGVVGAPPPVPPAAPPGLISC